MRVDDLVLVLFAFFIGATTCVEVDQTQNGEHAAESELGERNEKLFNVFTIVRFKNDPCQGSSNRNGTCYTESECSDRGGSNAGSCAQGFGVCCTFISRCGASVAENCTYFESNGGETGGCSLEICPCSSNICQMRLDFINFMVTGPSTSTVTIKGTVNGVITPGADVPYTTQTQCLTDTFTVTGLGTGQNSPPTICGINTGEHMYADMENGECNSLDFQLGTAGIDAQLEGNRGWNIKITQLDCNSELLAPQGCTQYFYGSDSQEVRSYNFNGGNGLHLANQNQNVCVRRERGNCKICWYAKDPKDVDTNSKNMEKKGSLGGDTGGTGGECCGYKTDGMGTKGYDCLQIPGAANGENCDPFSANRLNADRFCGNSAGLAIAKTATGTNAPGTNQGTVCTKQDPFSLQFLTDGLEAKEESTADVANSQAGSGFQLTYTMSSNNC